MGLAYRLELNTYIDPFSATVVTMVCLTGILTIQSIFLTRIHELRQTGGKWQDFLGCIACGIYWPTKFSDPVAAALDRLARGDRGWEKEMFLKDFVCALKDLFYIWSNSVITWSIVGTVGFLSLGVCLGRSFEYEALICALCGLAIAALIAIIGLSHLRMFGLGKIIGATESFWYSFSYGIILIALTLHIWETSVPTPIKCTALFGSLLAILSGVYLLPFFIADHILVSWFIAACGLFSGGLLTLGLLLAISSGLVRIEALSILWYFIGVCVLLVKLYAWLLLARRLSWLSNFITEAFSLLLQNLINIVPIVVVSVKAWPFVSAEFIRYGIFWLLFAIALSFFVVIVVCWKPELWPFLSLIRNKGLNLTSLPPPSNPSQQPTVANVRKLK